MRIPDLSDIPEQAAVAPGEYDLRVLTAKDVKSDRTGREGVMLVCEIVGEENAQNLFHRIWFPMENDPDTKATTMWRMIKEFLDGVGLPVDGCDTSDFENLQFSAYLNLTEDNNGRPINEIARVTS